MIERADHKSNFTRVQNELIQDARLTFEARGFLIFMLSLPDNWTFSTAGLARQADLPERSVMRLVKELKAAGYVSQARKKNDLGRFNSYEWKVTELRADRTTVEPNCGDTVLRESRTAAEPNCGSRVPIQTTNNTNDLIIQTTKDTKEPHGEFSNVMLTPEEFSKLEDRLGAADRDGLIFELSCYLKNHPKKYKDHYATILSWSRKRQKSKPKASGAAADPFGDLLKEEGYA